MKKILLGLIGLLFAVPAVAATLPAGYTELEYIESTGTQYIDTGYKPKTGDKIRIVYQYNSLYGGDDGRDATSIFGCTDMASATSAHNGVARVVQGTNTINRIAWGNGTNSVVGDLTYNNATGVWYDLVCDNGVFTINDTQLGTTSANSFSANFSMYLFARNTGGTAGLITKGKIQIAQVWDNGTLVRDFVPAKNSSGVVGMYDTVSGTFFTNQGTGEFIAGPVIPESPIKIATTAYNSARFSPVVTELNDTIATIRSVVTNTINQTKAIADLQATKQTRPDEQCPAGKKCLLVEDDAGQPHWYEIIESASRLPDGYTELEYIEGTGTQYIDTGIVPANKKIGMEAKFQFTSLSPATATIIGSGVTDNTDNCRLWGLFNERYRIKLGNTGMSYGTPDTNIHTVIVNMSDGGAWLDGQKIWTNPQQTIPTSNNKNLNIFKDNGGGGTFSSAKIYYIKLYDNDVLIADYIPARNSANKIGFYDTVSGRFFTNAGTGTFVTGPEI